MLQHCRHLALRICRFLNPRLATAEVAFPLQDLGRSLQRDEGVRGGENVAPMAATADVLENWPPHCSHRTVGGGTRGKKKGHLENGEYRAINEDDLTGSNKEEIAGPAAWSSA